MSPNHSTCCSHRKPQDQQACEAPGLDSQHAADAAAAAAADGDPEATSLVAEHKAALLSGDASRYATINALLKQLHEERLQRAAAVGHAQQHASGSCS